eukprot:13028512-Alexandrium_andersonii.AAC.1
MCIRDRRTSERRGALEHYADLTPLGPCVSHRRRRRLHVSKGGHGEPDVEPEHKRCRSGGA